MYTFAVFIFCLFSRAALAQINELAPITYIGQASFETLDQSSYAPESKIGVDAARGSLTDEAKYNSPFYQNNLGFPGGASAINVLGRSADDTQVTTLGVPLNLPQGGGADFAFFPSFLWNQILISQSTSGAGFSPNSSSGHVELIPWTRAKLLDQKFTGDQAFVQATYDHDVQTYSFGAKQKNVAMDVGLSSGLAAGASGSFSAILSQTKSHQILFHTIATEEIVASPGSLTYPSPRAQIHAWRVIPVFESSFGLAQNMQFQSTEFADLSGLKNTDPDNPSNDSNQKTQQVGSENVFVWNEWTLSASARFVHFTGASFGELNEWPLHGSLSREVFIGSDVSTKPEISATGLTKLGVYPGARLPFKFGQSEKNFSFAEAFVAPKMPTLVDRYANYGTFFQGNPDLKPEHVYGVLFGVTNEGNEMKNTVTLKGECRTGIQVATPTFSTVINGGDAELASINDEFHTHLTRHFDGDASLLLTASKLKDSDQSYPDLPYATTTLGFTVHDRDLFSTGAHARLVGTSAGPGGRSHPGYALFDVACSAQVLQHTYVTAGIDNLFNSDGQAVLDYPLEGRRFFAGVRGEL